MDAVILAGGEGTRLRPLTCALPKPLVPLCGRPAIEYILDLLWKHGCRKAVLTLLYRADLLRKAFPEEDYHGIALDFSEEEEPLGTAGSVKRAAEFDDDFLVISGDVLCDFDLSAALAFHRSRQAEATLLVTRVEDPREYGLVRSAPDGRITGFLEKPSRLHATTGLANTGIYILSPRILSRIPDGTSFDFSYDLFPAMLREGAALYACEAKGYWKDIGDIKSYLDGQRDLLEGKVSARLSPPPLVGSEPIRQAGAVLHPPVYLGQNVTIGEGAVIEAGSVLCDHVTVGPESRIRGSVLLPGSTVGRRCSVNRAVLCQDAVLESGSGVFEYAVVGRGATVGRCAAVASRVRVWDGKTVPAGMELETDLRFGDVREEICEERGIEGEAGSGINPAFCTRLGSALGSMTDRAVVAVGGDGTALARAFAASVLSGAAAAGAECWTPDSRWESAFRFALRKSDSAVGVFLETRGEHLSLRLYGQDGLPLSRKEERKLEGFLNRGGWKTASVNEVGEIVSLRGMEKLYEAALVRRAGSLAGRTARVSPPLSDAGELLLRVLKRAGCSTESGPSFAISPDGRRLTAVEEGLGAVPHERLVALYCAACFRSGKDAALPDLLLEPADELAGRYHRRVYRYESCPCDDRDQAARRLAAADPFAEDGLLLAVGVLRFLKENALDLREALREIPLFGSASCRVETPEAAEAVFRRIGKHFREAEEGMRLSDPRGELLFRPAKSGRGIFLYAESRDTETAEELCGFYGDLIRKGPLS